MEPSGLRREEPPDSASTSAAGPGLRGRGAKLLYCLTDRQIAAKIPFSRPTGQLGGSKGVFLGKPSAVFSPPGKQCRGWSPEGWVRWGPGAFCGSPRSVPRLPGGPGAHPAAEGQRDSFLSCAVQGWHRWGAEREPPGPRRRPAHPARPGPAGMVTRLPLLPQDCKAQQRMLGFKISRIEPFRCLFKAM